MVDSYFQDWDTIDDHIPYPAFSQGEQLWAACVPVKSQTLDDFVLLILNARPTGCLYCWNIEPRER